MDLGALLSQKLNVNFAVLSFRLFLKTLFIPFLGKKEPEKQPVCNTGNIRELRIFLCASISFCPYFSFSPVVLSETCGEHMI